LLAWLRVSIEEFGCTEVRLHVDTATSVFGFHWQNLIANEELVEVGICLLDERIYVGSRGPL